MVEDHAGIRRKLIAWALWEEVSKSARKKQDRSVEDDQAIVEAATVGLKDVGDLWRRGEIDKDEYLDLRRGFAADRDAAQKRIDSRARRSGRSAWIGRGDLLRTSWPSMTLDQQRAVVNQVIDTVTINPGTRRGNVFDPERVEVVWKV